MPNFNTQPRDQRTFTGVSTPRSPVSGVNAHLRIPRDPGDFRVVVTFHHADGLLCEAELKPVDAIGLMAEIGHVVDQGNSSRKSATLDKKRNVGSD